MTVALRCSHVGEHSACAPRCSSSPPGSTEVEPIIRHRAELVSIDLAARGLCYAPVRAALLGAPPRASELLQRSSEYPPRGEEEDKGRELLDGGHFPAGRVGFFWVASWGLGWCFCCGEGGYSFKERARLSFLGGSLRECVGEVLVYAVPKRGKPLRPLARPNSQWGNGKAGREEG